MAPEVVSKGAGYSKPSDWWSFGVFTFDLLTGRSPFYSNRGKAETKQRILHGKLILPVYVTRDAQDLIKKLLRRPVSRRLGTNEGAVEIKNHVFFKDIKWDDVLQKKLKPPFVPNVSGPGDVSNFDSRFTTKAISRESDERLTADAVESVAPTAARKDTNVADDEVESLFPGFEFVSSKMLAGSLEDKILALQDIRIRGYGSP